MLKVAFSTLLLDFSFTGHSGHSFHCKDTLQLSIQVRVKGFAVLTVSSLPHREILLFPKGKVSVIRCHSGPLSCSTGLSDCRTPNGLVPLKKCNKTKRKKQQRRKRRGMGKENADI